MSINDAAVADLKGKGDGSLMTAATVQTKIINL
jgi:hypothetical protein